VRFRLAEQGTRAVVDFDDGGMNLLSADALRELAALIPSLAKGSYRMMVFQSGRPSLFAAGADMSEMARFDAAQAYEFSRLGQETFDALERLPFVTVAMIDGDCFGGALDLAMSFDVRLATARSRFAHPGARIGIVTGFGGTSRWRKLMDRPAAHQLFLANRVLTAEEAAGAAIVDAVAADHTATLTALGSLDPREVTMVKTLTRAAPALTRSQLRLLSERLAQLYFP
jgi:enoyl-CoA hydratase/carnithine racemase